MQFTWAENYKPYGEYRRLPNHTDPYIERRAGTPARLTATTQHYTANPSDGGQLITWTPRFDPDTIGKKTFEACDSGGYYWVSKKFSQGMSINRVSDRNYSAENIGLINRLVNGGGNGYYE